MLINSINWISTFPLYMIGKNCNFLVDNLSLLVLSTKWATHMDRDSCILVHFIQEIKWKNIAKLKSSYKHSFTMDIYKQMMLSLSLIKTLIIVEDLLLIPSTVKDILKCPLDWSYQEILYMDNSKAREKPSTLMVGNIKASFIVVSDKARGSWYGSLSI